jgi:hypothetical protein
LGRLGSAKFIHNKGILRPATPAYRNPQAACDVSADECYGSEGATPEKRTLTPLRAVLRGRAEVTQVSRLHTHQVTHLTVGLVFCT